MSAVICGLTATRRGGSSSARAAVGYCRPARGSVGESSSVLTEICSSHDRCEVSVSSRVSQLTAGFQPSGGCDQQRPVGAERFVAVGWHAGPRGGPRRARRSFPAPPCGAWCRRGHRRSRAWSSTSSDSSSCACVLGDFAEALGLSPVAGTASGASTSAFALRGGAVVLRARGVDEPAGRHGDVGGEPARRAAAARASSTSVAALAGSVGQAGAGRVQQRLDVGIVVGQPDQAQVGAARAARSSQLLRARCWRASELTADLARHATT